MTLTMLSEIILLVLIAMFICKSKEGFWKLMSVGVGAIVCGKISQLMSVGVGAIVCGKISQLMSVGVGAIVCGKISQLMSVGVW